MTASTPPDGAIASPAVPETDVAASRTVPGGRLRKRVAAALGAVIAELPGGGEAREGQAAMADRVAEAISTGNHLVVRAGTGTGKTLAYLVPAVLSGKRVVVATATKALQDQLASKDLPFLDEHLDQDFDWAVLKGRSNYLCVQRLAEMDRTGSPARAAGAASAGGGSTGDPAGGGAGAAPTI